MKKLFLACLFFPFITKAQLTVEQIMQDPKWIGTSPSSINWNYDSKSIYFKWNPEKNMSDSAYFFSITKNRISKAIYADAQLQEDISNGTYNSSKTKIAFIHNGDVYLLIIASKKISRITQTTDEEAYPAFLNDDEIAYLSRNDLFVWNEVSGNTTQLTHFESGFAPPKKEPLTQQQTWLDSEALRTSTVLKRRKDKADATKIFLDSNREKPVRTIYLNNQEIISLNISADKRFVTYNLFSKNDETKETIVPQYVTLDGYTKELSSHTKVGRPDGTFSFYVYDKLKDTVIEVSLDSLPGIDVKPAYKKFYPKEENDSISKRSAFVQTVLWNDAGTNCVLDIFSFDNKDRWLMQLNDSTGKLSLINHQHDEAWVAGPGVAWLEPANLGWINSNTLYFQSEATGYSHLYSYNFQTKTTTALTSGNYEVQRAVLGNSKKYFYLITNEEAPTKQSIYRINTDGSNKIKLTTQTGGYEMAVSPDEKFLAYRYSYQTKPWELYLQPVKENAKPQQITNKAMSDSFKSYSWRDTKIFTFKARDSANVYARMYEPKPGTNNGAAVIFVHGAGYLQNVDYWWSYYFHEMMFNNLLADEGFTVMDIDYRGSAGYGRDWRTGIYRYMGGKDLDDEVDAAHYLVKMYGIDSTRIGMYGGSYGGFMTLMAMFTQPDVFKAGAALRPVTDWAHYNHEYTAAILNEPFTDSIAYARSSPINFASGLKNHLLICHGMLDVNVNFQDAVRLTQRLIELGKNNWQLAPYPMEDHGFIEPSSWTDEYKRILKLFNYNLLKK